MVRMWPVAGKEKAVMICRAFAEGVPRGANCHVFYGVNETNAEAWRQAQRSGHDWFYIDNSYFDVMRGQQYRVTKNRVQVDPAGKVSDGKRFDALGLKIAPLKPLDSQWLAVEQSPSFMLWVAQDRQWFLKTVENVRRDPGTHVKVRAWMRDKIKQQATLADDLKLATHLLTYSSAAAVEALLAGLTVCVSRMSALSGVPIRPSDDERRRVFGVLADNMWALDEIRAGKAWQWLAKN